MKRILIVDDNEPNLYLLRSLLRGHGYTVEEARDGAAALTLAHRNPPDMVISDLLMPVLDGFALLRHWKEDARLKSVPFVVYTATYTEPRDERLALGLGADAFIIKPSEPETFVARISELLAKAESGGLPTESGIPPPSGSAALLETHTQVLIGKLEKKARQLEQSNRELTAEIADRKRTGDMLRQSEERFRELAETIQEVFWMTDPDKQRMLYVSPAYEKIWGRTCASLYASPGSWLDAVHAEDRERILLAADAKQTRGEYDETYRILRPDGAVRWIRDRAFPVRDGAGKVVRVVGTAEDITDRRMLEEQFVQAQKLEAIGQLAAGVAHDFNNILAIILGNADLALARAGERRPVQDNLEEIRKAGNRARSMVRQILTFSRQHAQERQVIELGPTIQETVSFLHSIIPSHIDLAVSLEASAPCVLADSTQMHQVIANLCTNAWHALDADRGRIEVALQAVNLDAAEAARLSGIKPGRAACLVVTDNGKGMDAATLDRIFDPFFTTKEPGKGTGLGLSVVRGIVEGHDGAITVSSRPGRGTTFKVYLPAAQAPPTESAGVAAPAHGGGEHILYLDDEEPLAMLATRMLERLGYRATGCKLAADALKAFQDHPDLFDLVITDMNMPGSSGLGLAAALLNLRPDLPIVLCSGHVTEALRQRARNAGIRGLLYKPFTLEELSEAIHPLVVKPQTS